MGQGARARADPDGAGPVPRLAPRQPPHGAGRSRSASARSSTCPNGERVPARRLRRPARARRRRPGRGRRPQDRPHQALGQVGADQRPARPLPARRRPRRRRRARRRRTARGRAAPSSSSSGCTGDAEHATVQRQPVQADDGPERDALRGRLQPGGRRCCAARTSPRSPASTAATATSSRSARSRARARWSAS